MTDTSSPTSAPARRSRSGTLAVVAGVASALVLVAAVTGPDDDDAMIGSTSIADGADESADGATAGDEAASDSDAPSDGDAAAESAEPDGDAADGGETTGDGAAPPAPSGGGSDGTPTRVGSLPTESAPPPDGDVTTTTIGGSGPVTVTTIAVDPPPTTQAIVPPPSTIVITLPTTTIVVPPPTTTVAPVALTDGCAVLGIDDFGDVLIELTVTSPTTEVALLEVGFVLNDGGEEIVTDFLTFEFMSPGEGAVVVAETFETVPDGSSVSALSCLIDAVNELELFDNQVLPGPDDVCSVLGVDEIGDLQLTATVRNPSPETADLTFSFAVRDPRGVRVISDAGFADQVGSGQVVTQDVDTLVPPPPGLDVASLTCDVVGLDLF